jgi:hypothetical protein
VIDTVLPPPEGLEAWGNAAEVLLQGALHGAGLPDDLLDALEAIAAPEGSVGGLERMMLWRRGMVAKACDPEDPRVLLDHLFSCSGLSRP